MEGLTAQPAGGTLPGAELSPHRDARGHGAGLVLIQGVLIQGILSGPVRFHRRLKAAWRSPDGPLWLR